MPVSDSPDATAGERNEGSAGGLGVSVSTGHRGPAVGRTSNRDWWPHQLDLAILRRHLASTDPTGADFDYAAEFLTVDLDALARDVDEGLTTSQEGWPGGVGHHRA